MLFSKLSRTTFSDKDFRQLDSAETQLLWLYLVSSPKNTSLPGLMMLSFEEMLTDLGWEDRLGDRARAQLEASLQELQDKDWVRYHRDLGMLLSTRIFDLNVPSNPSVVAHWLRLILDMPRNVLIDMWAGMARTKFRDLDRSAANRLGGKAWRLDALEEFLADVDDCYSPPSEFDDDLLTEEDRKYIRVPANKVKARVYPPLSMRRRKRPGSDVPAPTGPATGVADAGLATDAPALPLTEDVAKDLLARMALPESPGPDTPLELFGAALERGADVVAPSKAADQAEKKPRVKPDIRQRVSLDCRRLVDYFLRRLKQDKPDAKLPTGDTLDAWFDDMDRMLRIDNRKVDQIGTLIEWVTQDEFEKGNVRCPRKLRQRFDQLEIKKQAWEAKQERLADAPANGGYRREEPAYAPNYGVRQTPLTEEELREQARVRALQDALRVRNEERIRRDGQERQEREARAQEAKRQRAEQQQAAMQICTRIYEQRLAQEKAAAATDRRELLADGIDVNANDPAMREAAELLLMRRRMRRLRAMLVARGYVDATAPAVEEDASKTPAEVEVAFIELMKARNAEGYDIQHEMGLREGPPTRPVLFLKEMIAQAEAQDGPN